MPSTLPDLITQNIRYAIILACGYFAGHGVAIDAGTQQLLISLGIGLATAGWGWYVKKGTVSVPAEVARPSQVVSPVTGQTK